MKVGDLIRMEYGRSLWVVTEISPDSPGSNGITSGDILVMNTKSGLKMWSSSDYWWEIVCESR